MIIRSVYRPVVEMDWVGDLRQFADEAYPDKVNINESDLVVDIITRGELRTQRFDSESARGAISRLHNALPDTFNEDLLVGVNGVTYLELRKNKSPIWPLILKVTAPDALLEENHEAVVYMSKHGVIPKGMQMRFSTTIGSVNMLECSGEAKNRLRLGLSSHAPQSIVLGPGVIK